MKNLLFATGIVLLILNTLVGLLISSYNPFNFVSVDISIAISTILIYLIFNSNISNGYKIGLTTLFIISGLIKSVCLAVGPAQFSDNSYLVASLVLLAIEVICLFSAMAMKKFA